MTKTNTGRKKTARTQTRSETRSKTRMWPRPETRAGTRTETRASTRTDTRRRPDGDLNEDEEGDEDGDEGGDDWPVRESPIQISHGLWQIGDFNPVRLVKLSSGGFPLVNPSRHILFSASVRIVVDVDWYGLARKMGGAPVRICWAHPSTQDHYTANQIAIMTEPFFRTSP